MNTVRNYIIIDDDHVNNAISRVRIKKTLEEVDTVIFTVPEEGLAFIQNVFAKCPTPTILFLDINMPSLTGWEFLEHFEKFCEEVKKQITIYMLSSSIDQRDMDKANVNKYVKGFISKPLERDTIRSIASGLL